MAESNDNQEEDEPGVYRISSGPFLDFINRLPSPVLALPGRDLYCVVVEGTGMDLPIDGGGQVRGFYTGWFAAARSDREAETKILGALKEWCEALYPDACHELELKVTKVERRQERFLLRGRKGLVFF